jgi:hypothetical protein
MQKAQQAFLHHHLGMGSIGHADGMSMASGGAGGDDGWLKGFLAHGQMAQAPRGWLFLHIAHFR